MLIKRPFMIASSEITPRPVYLRRRDFLRRAVALGLLGGSYTGSWGQVPAGRTLTAKASALSTREKATAYEHASGYVNFYEFGTDKGDPPVYAPKMKTRPWSVMIDGEVKRKGPLDIEDLLKLAPMEERIYRLRCVEAWSMVIPWVGFSFAELVKRVEPTSRAKYVAFTTRMDPESMVGLNLPVLNWPYSEGLRLDEAMHPLTLLAFGMYGQTLPNQNGAPVRIVVPWKYGFKSAKSIVKITFTEHQPNTAWNDAAAREYGFYSNVNPEVDHPRWSQATERRIGEDGFFTPKRKTLMFNGYADQVAGLYTGMDLKKNF
ncbi:MAG: protein-methionine-sulfoxide reductase catalytic subunit MsrP [Betaproteobacteria bacterium]|nr:protein-methionine-sulfoxide reductase catalytic subunit MsrP [Betaproteobacteria bacterium]